MQVAQERKADERRRMRTVAVAVLLVSIVAAVVLAVTTLTGFPVPGMRERYPDTRLQALATKVNDIYAGSDCPAHQKVASVDTWRSRVQLHSPPGIGAGLPLRAGVSYNGPWDGIHQPVPLRLTTSDLAMIENPRAPLFNRYAQGECDPGGG